MTTDRRTIASALSGSTLTGPGAQNMDYRPIAVMPDVKVVKIGGQSILDRGRAALFPILDELVEARKRGIQFVVLSGGGTRARHIYSIASELELPTGVVATLGKYIPMQNARMLQMLLAKHGGLYIMPDDFEKLPLYLTMGCIPIMSGMPPFGYWEKREEGSRIPPHRTDAGVFLSAEFLGSKRAIFIKDEEGLYTDDPKKNPKATHIPRITASELQKRVLPDMVIERVVVEYLPRAQWCKELQIVNGLKPGQVLAALEGQDVGTIITA
jgi:molybdenum storage protein